MNKAKRYQAVLTVQHEQYAGMCTSQEAEIILASSAAVYEELIERLLDALCARNADDYVDKIRDEYGV